MPTQHQDRSRRRLTATVTDLEVARQRALLIGVTTGREDRAAAEASLEELARLVDTAGSESVDSALQHRPTFDATTLIGEGKAGELAASARLMDVDVVVFDNPLSPAQQRNLQGIFGCDVVDREAVILDIFAQHATSRAGMLQVELAQLRYRLPRLRGRGVELSRLGGGIGTRGPGETKLETDRRRIAERIRKLEVELRHLGRTRTTQRKGRTRAGLPTVALVGYTNAGKSTLLNRLTGAHALVEDRLFSTLDPTIRRFELPGGAEVLIADTVGFVRRLPHKLVEAFRATLEEVARADLLIHVVDGSQPDPEGQIEAVRTVLGEIGAAEVPELMVLNKGDIADPTAFNRLRLLHADAVPISAVTGHGIEDLLEAIGKGLNAGMSEVELLVPYDRGDIVAAVHRRGEVLSSEHRPHGTLLRARLPHRAASELARLLDE